MSFSYVNTISPYTQTLLAMVVAMSVTLAPNQARADEYISAFASAYSSFNETNVRAFGTKIGKVSPEGGFAGTVAIGKAFYAIRVEAELGYRNAKFYSLKPPGTGTASAFMGNVWALSMMANAWYEFRPKSDLTPYIGGGIGLARLNGRLTNVGGTLIDEWGNDLVFAYQLGSGLSYKFHRGVRLTAGYRYFGTDTATYSGFAAVQARYSSHNLELGIMFDL